MSSDMPDPFVPPEVDLRDFDYIPLYGVRLFNSDTWALCDADEKVAALRLWWQAWHEEPAGSLPNNDRLLAERAGYGVAVKAFLAVKNNAMRGWIVCTDGRLYHPVVASIALEVWRTKRRKVGANEAERERKRRKRTPMSAGQEGNVRRTGGQCPPDKRAYNPEIPADIDDFTRSVPPENALKGIEKEDIPPSPLPGGEMELAFAEFWKAYPRRDDRGHALKAYRAARKRGVDAEVLLAGARRYSLARKGQDAKFTALGATWLTGERWADESIALRPRTGGVIPMHPGAGG